MKPEILAPVGNIDHLYAALAAGCDAVYFALPDFSARAFAKNLSLEQAKEAIDLCHLYGVKVYITMNTILYEEEIEQAYQQAKTCVKMGADALIVQDLGLMYLIHHRLPQATIHASTQMSIATPEEIERLKQLGIKRVILARECSKEMVESCKQAGLEVEIFIHGALCISMSGRCLFSSFQYQRSGNRGMCAQPCRMEYQLWEDGKRISTDGNYLISPKDVSLIDSIQELDVDCVKIEGRMKCVEYVYESVRQARLVRDGYKRSEQDKEQLKTAFYRGYTLGHYYDQRGKDFISQRSSNHIGVPIGTVQSVSSDKIQIVLKKDLYQHDGIRFGQHGGGRINYLYDQQGKLQNKIPAGQIAQVERIPSVKKGDVVTRTASSQLEQKTQKAIKEINRKVPVQAKVLCQGIGKPLECILTDGVHTVHCISEEVAQPAKNQALSQEVISKQMHKTKNVWAEITSLEVDIQPGLFFMISSINQLRRDAIDALQEKRIEIQPIHEQDGLPVFYGKPLQGIIETLPTSCAGQDWNITNSYAVSGALEIGYDQVQISEECTDQQMRELLEGFEQHTGQKAPAVKLLYGHRRLMIMKHCPVNTNRMDGQRENCQLCHNHQYELVGKDGNHVLCIGDKDCNMGLYEKEPVNRTETIRLYQEMGVEAFLVSFLNETQEEKHRLLESI